MDNPPEELEQKTSELIDSERGLALHIRAVEAPDGDKGLDVLSSLMNETDAALMNQIQKFQDLFLSALSSIRR